MEQYNDGPGKLQNCMIAFSLDSFLLYVTVTTLMHKSFVQKVDNTSRQKLNEIYIFYGYINIYLYLSNAIVTVINTEQLQQMVLELHKNV